MDEINKGLKINQSYSSSPSKLCPIWTFYLMERVSWRYKYVTYKNDVMPRVLCNYFVSLYFMCPFPV